MKHAKMFGLCLLGVVAAMAVMGVGTASASKLCTENKTPCPAGSTIASGTALKGQLRPGTEAVFTTSLLTVKCTESTIEGKTTSAGGGAGVNVKGEIATVTWKNCKSGSTSCTTTALGLPWLSEVSGSAGSGTMTVNKAAGKFTCGGVTCEYEAASAATSVTGGNPAIVKASSVSFKKKGGSFLCPATSTWSSEYEITTPKPLFVESE
jgi:hypothetical protein